MDGTAYAILLACLSILLAIPAFLAAFLAWGTVRRWKDIPAAKAEKLESIYSDIDERIHNLSESHKRLRARVGMRDLRERRGGPDAPAEAALDVPRNASAYSDYKARLREKVGLLPGKAPPRGSEG